MNPSTNFFSVKSRIQKRWISKMNPSTNFFSVMKSNNMIEIQDGQLDEQHDFDKMFCYLRGSRFNFYQKNESHNQAGVDSCDQCGEVVRY
jgi:hypothetical protein